MHPAIAVILVFVGCCCNVVYLELLITDCPGSGNIIIFCQFLFITVEGFIFTTKFGTKSRSIPFICYVKMTALYAVNVGFQNILLHFKVDIPLQQLLRSGSLIANLLLGVIVLKKSYPWSKYVSVSMISFGIMMATIASADSMIHWDTAVSRIHSNRFYSILFGIGVLILAFFTSALMGIYQEFIFKQYGKHADEALFYNHLLPLPVFLFLAKDITYYFHLFNQSELKQVPVLNVFVPKLWLYLAGNVFTQYLCIASVFTLTAECSSLTVNLVVTLRKFLSLLFSVIYFNNSFSMFHWSGAFLVFAGTLLFSDAVYNCVLGGRLCLIAYKNHETKPKIS